MNKAIILYCAIFGMIFISFTCNRQKSSINRNSIIVKNYLTILHSKTKQLCDTLEQSKYASQKNVRRLLKKRNVSIVQRSNTKNIAYSVNKGEEIGICVSGNNIDSMFYVLLHELSHIMTVSKHHTEEFWANFKFLVNFAQMHGIYREQESNSMYCGQQIK